jgi:Leucine-rich repeat (LRR) protein
MKSLLPVFSCIFLLVFTGNRLHAQESISNVQQPVLLDSATLDTMAGFTDLNEALKNPEKVTKLTLKKMHYKAFPAEIWKFPNLQYLDLSKNQITDFPDSLGQLKNLQVLHLAHNKIEALPRELGDLQNLFLLDINNNQLTMLPPQIGKLKKLQYLDLWSNSISIFPDELKDISENLKVLDLRVILINYDAQDRIRKMLPKTTIYMDAPCHCNQ